MVQDMGISNAVVYTGTHHNPTTPGWFEDLLDDQRQNLWKCMKRATGAIRDAKSALMDLEWSSAAALPMAPLQHLLNLGKEASMNVLGRAVGNWRWRCTQDMISDPAFEWLRGLTKSSNLLGMIETQNAGKALEVV